MKKSFVLLSVAKWVSLAVASLALAGCLFMLFGFLKTFGPPRFDTPVFSEEILTRDHASRRLWNLDLIDREAEQEKLRVTNEYGEKILAIIKEYNLMTTKTDHVIEWLVSDVPEERRRDFVSGWQEFLGAGVAHLKKTEKFQSGDKSTDRLTEIFRLQFRKAMNQVSDAETAAKDKRPMAFGVAIALALLFSVAMIVPVLTRIECNTRPRESAASARNAPGGSLAAGPAPDSNRIEPTTAKTAAPTACPKCAAAAGKDDVFCGECGASLR
ncbi:MAG: zinc ribbon domain-containing protein [Zoogloeaceae bacterium]|jgi:hypothetical protein|nr:zinc ribbon domain-containing protein [Zoogloeaceae bacterium]